MKDIDGLVGLKSALHFRVYIFEEGHDLLVFEFWLVLTGGSVAVDLDAFVYFSFEKGLGAWRYVRLCSLKTDFHDFILLEAQVIILEALELGVAVWIGIGEFDGLIEVFAFFDELDFEEIAFGLDFHGLDFEFGLKSGSRLVGPDLNPILLGFVYVNSSGHEIEFNVTLNK